MNPSEVAERTRQLREEGFVVVPRAFSLELLEPLQRAAAKCFQAIEGNRGQGVSERYKFTPFSNSVVIGALMDYGCAPADLTAPLTEPGVALLFSEATECSLECNPEQSWIRKRYAPAHAPAYYHPNRWHQDGALGARFPAQPGSPIPMNHMLTCWIPLTPCGRDRPGLELVRRRLHELLHYMELGDEDLRRRFPADEFCAPELEVGDGLIFLDGTLHRTYDRPDMERDRLSVEYRFFPR